jgi:hypothetical protein
MRNLFFPGSFDHSAEGFFQDAEKTINNFRLVPKALKTLYPLKVRNDYTARVAKYIRDYKDFSPTFEQNLIHLDGRRSIGGFRQDPATKIPGVLSANDCLASCSILLILVVVFRRLGIEAVCQDGRRIN